jgi:hypothetical protein
MALFTRLRDGLRATQVHFSHLDAAQLVRHAFGLVTEGRRTGKLPVLLYLYAEPTMRDPKGIAPELLLRHRAEIAAFSSVVSGAAVRFAACSYREWLAGWTGDALQHAEALVARFQP